jgi:mannonate dehydratase
VAPLLIGRDARRIEDTWQYLYKGAYWRRGPVTMTAISAVDTALWGIRGKTLNTPVYQLLGGASRESVLVYGHANGKTIDDTVSAVAEYVALGYRAIRAQCGVPGMPDAYGVGRGTLYYRPAEKQKPHETVWNTALSRRRSPALRSASSGVRSGRAPASRRPSPSHANRSGAPRRGARTASPVLARGSGSRELQEGFRLIRQHTTTPLAVGEVFNSIHDCQQLIQSS